MKAVLKFLVGFLVAVLVIVMTSPLWLGPVVKLVAERVAPAYTGTAFAVESIGLNPFTGHLAVRGLRIANPEGYDDPDAVRVGELTLDVSVASLFTDVIRFGTITVVDPYVSYLSNDGKNNFDSIREHAQKGETKPEPAAENDAGEDSSKRVAIDKIILSGTQVKVAMLPAIPLPSFTVEDVGEDEEGNAEGASWEDVRQKVWDAMEQAMSNTATGTGALLKGLSDVVPDVGAGDAANAAGDGADAAARKVKKFGKGASALLKGIFK